MTKSTASQKTFWASEALIARIPKSDTEVVEVTACTSAAGNGYVNVRVWYRAADGEYRPGKQGFNIPYDIAADVTAALANAIAHLEEN